MICSHGILLISRQLGGQIILSRSLFRYINNEFLRKNPLFAGSRQINFTILLVLYVNRISNREYISISYYYYLNNVKIYIYFVFVVLSSRIHHQIL